jgi:hypothetical protein
MTDEIIQIHFALAQPFACKGRPAFPFHQVHYRRLGTRQVPVCPRAQRLALLLVVLVNGLGVLLVGHWLYRSRTALAEETAGKHLQVAHSSPKFNFISAKTPAEKDRPAPVQAPAAPSASPPLEPVKIELPPPPLEPVDPVDPLDFEWDPILAYSSTLASHRGDTPMLRNWKLLELAALLAVAVPSPIVLAGGESKETDKAILERVEKMVKDIRTEMAQVRSQLNSLTGSLATATKEVENLKGEITPLKGVALRMKNLGESFASLKADLERLKPADNSGMEDVKTRLANIERALAGLQTEKRTSLSPAPTATPTTTGKITLNNNYTDKLLFLINDRQFFVEPGQTQTVEGVPVGPFTYEVFSPRYGSLGKNSRTLDPSRTFTLNATLP